MRRARHVAPRTDLRPPRLAAALAGSLAFHAAVVGLLALLVGIGASGPGKPHDAAPLRATLAARAVLATPPEAPAQPTPPRPAYAPVVRVPVTASLPVPLRPAVAKPAAAERYEGLVSILPDDGSALDPDVARAVAALYPAAMRGPVEFDVPPVGRYPEAARAERRQQLLRVVAIVDENGSVALAEGTVHDPLFLPAIRDALAAAKAQPPLVDGTPRAMWTVLTFYFEYYASGESQRSRHEPR